MLDRPAFRSAYQVQVVPGEGVLLLSDHGDQVLCGALYEHLAPWLTGRHSSDEVVASLASEHGPAEVYYALLELENRGYLSEAGDGVSEAMGYGLVVREGGDIPLVLTDDYLRPELEDINRRALQDRRPWLLVKTCGDVAWIGPHSCRARHAAGSASSIGCAVIDP